jgi:hypothetical protein
VIIALCAIQAVAGPGGQTVVSQALKALNLSVKTTLNEQKTNPHSNNMERAEGEFVHETIRPIGNEDDNLLLGTLDVHHDFGVTQILISATADERAGYIRQLTKGLGDLGADNDQIGALTIKNLRQRQIEQGVQNIRGMDLEVTPSRLRQVEKRVDDDISGLLKHGTNVGERRYFEFIINTFFGLVFDEDNRQASATAALQLLKALLGHPGFRHSLALQGLAQSFEKYPPLSHGGVPVPPQIQEFMKLLKQAVPRTQCEPILERPE